MSYTDNINYNNNNNNNNNNNTIPNNSNCNTNNKEQTCLIRPSIWYTEHRDLMATAMSIDWSGRWVLLAGRKHLALQSVDQQQYSGVDDGSLKKFHRNSKHEVSAAEFAICQHSQEYCAIATSQLIEVVTWRYGDPTLIHSLRAHTRVITDIDWHACEPHLLASCSIDTFTHLWDLRDPRKPMLSLSAVCMSGATQVGFNRVSGNLLATAHDGDLRIWDKRKGTCPVQYITAHLARIHGINWSHRDETYLTTASQDGTVKYFDINNPRRADRIITTASPVWRARYTPFANGLVTVIVPHLGRGENSLLLWNNTNQTAPICSFVGHTDVVLDFTWKPNRFEGDDMELITWSRDQTLRIWKVDEPLKKLCETPIHDDDVVILDDIPNPINSQQQPTIKSTQIIKNEQLVLPSYSLQHEFSLLNTNIPHIDVEVLDPIKRNAIFRISVNTHIIMLQITFPMDYPNDCTPEFVYCQGTSIHNNVNLSTTLMKVLRTCAYQRVRKGRTCLEQCLRALVTTLKKATSSNKSNLRLQSPRLEGALSGALHDACVPFPRTSSARFCQIGILVTFCQPSNAKRITFRHQNTTPRALSALNGGYLGNVMGSQPVLYAHRETNATAYFFQDRVKKTVRSRGVYAKPCVFTVLVYNVEKLIFISKELAQNYIVDSSNLSEMCTHNRMVAEKYGNNEEIVQCWTIANIIAISYKNLDTPNDDNIRIYQIPFAKTLLESLIMHFAKNFDIQTAAMLCYVFGAHSNPIETVNSRSSSNRSIACSPNSSPYNTILPVDSKIWNMATQIKQLRSNSWSESFDDWRNVVAELNRTLLDDSQKQLYYNFKRAYAEILFRWGLLVDRAKILKYTKNSMELCRGVEFVTECLSCTKVTSAAACKLCHTPLLYCMLCRLPVKGAANACLHCGHGGHTEHMRLWFSKNDVCATGCGCYCLKESSNLVHF